MSSICSGKAWEWEVACRGDAADPPCRVWGGAFAQAAGAVACGSDDGRYERRRGPERIGLRCRSSP